MRLTVQDHGAPDAREIGLTLARAAFDRGERLTDAQREAMEAPDAPPPVRKLGRGWIIDCAACRGSLLHHRKRDALAAWDVLVAKWAALTELWENVDRSADL